MSEIWKDVKGFEGLYQVSNYGNVKSLFRYKKKLTKFIQPNGYQTVTLYKNKKKYCKFVHRLVGEAFIDNPLNKPQINHKDENKQNNHVENLEWVTNKENQNYGTGIKRMAQKQGKKIVQYDLSHNMITTYYSGGDAQRKTGVSRYKISLVAHHKRKTAGGFIWRFADV